MNLRLFLKTYSKPFYCILFGKRKDTWRMTRCVCSAIVGTVCALLLCKCIFKSFFISNKYENSILLITMPVVAITFIFTDAVKCITFLIFLSFFGKSGRSYLRALSFAIIISGPIANLSLNASEILRTFSCSKVLAINLTRTRYDLMMKPFQKTLIHMKEDIRDVKETFNQLGNVTKDLHQEVMLDDADKNAKHFAHESELNAEFVQNRYMNKFRKRCLQQLDNGKNRCLKAFSNVLKKCHHKMPFILKTFICWPFKVDFICKINVLGNPEKICNPVDVVPDNFGESYMQMVATENELNKGSSHVKVNYTILGKETVPGAKLAEETAKNIINEFKVRKRVFDSILKILQQLLGFVFLRVIYDCVKYHKMYKEDLNHDNIYLTDYFKHVEKRRKSQNKQSLLPLKKYEKRHLLCADYSWRHTQAESQAFIFYLLEFSLEIVTCCFFVFLDYVLVCILIIIRNNSEMSFVQEGEHTIEFQIQGSGLIARLLKNTMGNFNMHETVSTYLTNKMCIPVPTILPQSFYSKLAALYFFVLLMIYQSSRFLRFRRSICGYFYQKREKRRILYLYNRMLKQRRTIRETMMAETKYNLPNQQIRLQANLFLILRLKWPQYFNWLVKFQMGRRKCIICGELEDLNFVDCNNQFCKVTYCNECFNDMDNSCWICDNVLAVDILLNFNDFFESFSFV